jgi:8-oxo-dGTP diphosphatase
VNGDGNGWVECALGHRHWGVHGAAGLLVYALDAEGEPRILMQHRAAWTNEGDTWGVPGGARDSHEDAATAALREADEEAGIVASDVHIREVSRDDHGGWAYDTVLADTPSLLATVANKESESLDWVALSAVDSRRLHSGFASTWPRHEAVPVTVVVDSANVVGSRPNGWWRDRAGAARDLRSRLESWRGRLLHDPTDQLRVVTGVVLVVEGDARAVAGDVGGWVRVVAAPESGDDTIVDEVSSAIADGAYPLLVTADRELRGRTPAAIAGPTWLHDRLPLA